MIKRLRYRKWKKIIEKSGLFDVKYYLFTYPDVRHQDIDPVMHYIKYGANEGRNPNKEFNTNFYLTNYPDVKESKMNPLIHYIEYGVNEGRIFNEIKNSLFQNSNLLPQITNEKIVFDKKLENLNLVTILCRTYNHEQFIEETLNGIISQNTNFRFKILIGDDLSTDSTPTLLQSYKKKYPELIEIITCKEKLYSVKNLMNLSKYIETKYVAICDGDDKWIDPYKLYKQVYFLENNLDYQLCFHKVLMIDHDRGINTIVPNNVKETTTFSDLIRGNYIYMSSVMYRWAFQSGLNEKNFNLDAMPADWQLHLLHAMKGKIKFLSDTMSVYNRHSEGMWNSSNGGLSIHLKHGLKEINLFKHFETYENGKYKTILIEKQYFIFKKLSDYYLENLNYELLYNLILENKTTYRKVFSEYGYLVDNINLETLNSFIDTLSSQNTITVVVTSYNHEKYIRQAIESILKQKGLFKIKVLLGDDYSTDNTIKILNEYLYKYPDIFINNIQTMNVGMRGNLKNCFSKVSSEFIAICEGDDYWIDDRKLHVQIDFLRKNLDCAMCFNWLSLYREGENRFEPHPQQGSLNQNKLTLKELSKMPIIGNFSACCYRTSAVKNIPYKYYQDPLAFDWLFNMYIAKQGKIGFIKKQLSVYRIHDKGQWSSNDKQSMQNKIKRSQENFYNHFTKKEIGD